MLATSVLLALCLILFRDAVFLNRVLVPADLSFALDPVWRDAAPVNFHGPTNPLLSDQAYQMYPWREYVRFWLRQGELPLWNMTIMGGVSLVGNDQSALFYPLNLLADLMPVARGLAFTTIARLMIAGLGTYAYLRIIGRSIPAAYVGSIAFGFSGFLIVWLGHPHANVAVWLPLILFCLEWLFQEGRGAAIALLAIGVGAQFLGGHVETSFHILLTSACYGLFLTGRTWSRGDGSFARRAVISSLVGTLLGVAIGAVQLLPFFEQLRQSTLFDDRSVSMHGTSWAFYPNVLLRLMTLPTIVFPNLLGSPIEGVYWSFDDNYNEYSAYVGTIPLLLAILAVWRCRGDRRVVFWGVTAGVSLAVAYRLPLFEAMNHLPIVRVVANGRLRLIASFSLATLAATGLDRLLDALHEGSPLVRYRLARGARAIALLALLAAVGLVAIYVSLLVWREPILTNTVRYVEAMLSSRGDLYQPRDYYVAKVLPYYSATVARFSPGHLPTYAPIVSALLLAASIRLWFRGWLETRVIRVLLPVATAVELLLYGSGYNPAIDSRDVFPRTPVLNFLQSHVGTDRVAGLGFTLLPNSATLYNLQDIRGYEVVRPDRSWSLLRDIEGRQPFGDYLLLGNARSPLLNLWSVRYIVATASSPPSDVPGLRRIFGDGDITVYENPNALPRAYVTPNTLVLPDASAVLGHLRAPSFDPRDEVLLEAAQQPPDASTTASFEPATIVEYRPDRVVVRATPSASGYLVLTDTYDDGWKATIDGQPTVIYRADYAFRAVHLDAGYHQIAFVYQPLSVVVGGWLMVAGLLGCIVVMLPSMRYS